MFTAGKLYQSTADGVRAVYLGDRVELFNIDAKKELVPQGSHIVVLEVHPVKQSDVLIFSDLYVLTKNGNLGWTRAHPMEYEEVSSVGL